MKTSQRGVDLIKSFEGCSLKAVKLQGEQFYTIGYGHYGADVRRDQTMTLAQAEALLRQDLSQFETYVSTYTAYAKFKPNQNQFDALVSFTYNCGPGSLKNLVFGRTAEAVAEHITAYTGSSSEIYREGLTRRRNTEKALFLEKDKEEIEMTKEELLSLDGTGDKPSKGMEAATAWAKTAGLFHGDGKGNYGWQQPITREQLAVVLQKLSANNGK